MAAVISLLNDYRLYRGREPFGFINPWLYGEGGRYGGLIDVTEGNNPGCGTDGFKADIGWDPVRPHEAYLFRIQCWLIFGSVGDRSRDTGLF